jgi:hypothetical protein
MVVRGRRVTLIAAMATQCHAKPRTDSGHTLDGHGNGQQRGSKNPVKRSRHCRAFYLSSFERSEAAGFRRMAHFLGEAQ